MSEQQIQYRCDDKDRDEAVKILSHNHAIGALDLVTFESRMAAAMAATHEYQLEKLTADLYDPPDPWETRRKLLSALLPAGFGTAAVWFYVAVIFWGASSGKPDQFGVTHPIPGSHVLAMACAGVLAMASLIGSVAFIAAILSDD